MKVRLRPTGFELEPETDFESEYIGFNSEKLYLDKAIWCEVNRFEGNKNSLMIHFYPESKRGKLYKDVKRIRKTFGKRK